MLGGAVSTAPFVAPSLATLRRELNARWPNRDRRSDGAVGDTAHAARVSDHNPDWTARGQRAGIVRAIDVDKDGISVPDLLVATIGDRRVEYVIWDRRIWRRKTGWENERYLDVNPAASNLHTEHVHISGRHTETAEFDTSEWGLLRPPPELAPQPDPIWEDHMILIECIDDEAPKRLFSYDGSKPPQHRVASGAIGRLVEAGVVKVVGMRAREIEQLHADHVRGDRALQDDLITRVAAAAADPAEVEAVMRRVLGSLG